MNYCYTENKYDLACPHTQKKERIFTYPKWVEIGTVHVHRIHMINNKGTVIKIFEIVLPNLLKRKERIHDGDPFSFIYFHGGVFLFCFC